MIKVLEGISQTNNETMSHFPRYFLFREHEINHSIVFALLQYLHSKIGPLVLNQHDLTKGASPKWHNKFEILRLQFILLILGIF